MLDHEPTIEKQLWQAVLLRAVSDLMKSKSIYEPEFEAACSWVGKYPSRDFVMVCVLAGFEVDFVHPRLLKMINARMNKDNKKFKPGLGRIART